MKTILETVLAAACLLTLAAPAAAQAPGVELKLNPRVGAYVPLTDFSEVTSGIDTERTGSLALGLGAELGLGGLPFNLRANLDYVTGSEIDAAGTTIDGVDTRILMVAGDLVFRPLPKLILIQPYLYAGGGLRQYDFDTDDTQALEDASDPMIHLGGGLDLSLGALALNAEIGDYISWYEVQDSDSETQHDLFVSVGLVFGLF
ncbi:MAG: outer membrane beta-barrel protein [Candidatus Longimicrobiales bacterium M2_2A_002]